MLRRTVGIDLAISAAQVAQIFDEGWPVGKAIRFFLKAANRRVFVARVIGVVRPGTPIEAVMAPTGMAWFPIATWLPRAGVKVIRVKGEPVRALRKYLREHTKPDGADMHVLGAIPNFGGPALDAVHVPSPGHHDLQRLTKQRLRYQDAIWRGQVARILSTATPLCQATMRPRRSWPSPSVSFRTAPESGS
jgi:transposase